jgi:hypothetical protein
MGPANLLEKLKNKKALENNHYLKKVKRAYRLLTDSFPQHS